MPKAMYSNTDPAFLAQQYAMYKNPGIGAVASNGDLTGTWAATQAVTEVKTEPVKGGPAAPVIT